MLNEYVWKLYLDAGGRETTAMFERNLAGEFSEEYIKNVCRFQAGYCPSKHITSDTRHQLRDLLKDLRENRGLLEDGEYTIQSALEILYDGIKGDDDPTARDVFDYFSSSIVYFTTFLAAEIPELFVPYYFECNFNVLEKIAQEFGIEFLPIPAKRNYEDRFYYYGAICIALQEFREKHGLSPYELCAFLYDFAPKYIGGIDSYIIRDLPEPKSAFFIGGSSDDAFRNTDENVITPWQCSPDTDPGDMIVMYLKTPVSAVDSVWRSVSIGFNDPFFYYYRCTYIARPTGIKRITLEQLTKDPVMKELSIVRKNMQGINGVELRPSMYNYLMDLAGTGVLRLEAPVSENEQEFENEKDVENKLIKPLIAKLGYSESEYLPQLHIAVGNHNHMLIPDFVLHPITTTGHHSAFAIIEAKYTISSQKALDEVRMQARSYAVQLKAHYSVIASKDGLWVSSPEDDFTDDIFIAAWNELNNPDVFAQLYRLIGNHR